MLIFPVYSVYPKTFEANPSLISLYRIYAFFIVCIKFGI